MSTYEYSKTINSTQLSTEIRASSITIALERVDTAGLTVSVVFKADLSAGEITTLDTLVAAHVPVSETKTPDIVILDSLPTFTSKKIGTKSLNTRVKGIVFPVIVGASTYDFNIPYDLVKFNALEIVNAAVGDTADLKVLDTPTGTFSTVPNFVLNQFGFAVNIAPGLYVRESKYDADLIKDMKIRVVYNSLAAKTVYMNFILHELKN